jgi:hypothetical protein
MNIRETDQLVCGKGLITCNVKKFFSAKKNMESCEANCKRERKEQETGAYAQ